MDRIIDNRKGEKMELGDLLESAMDKAIDTLSMNFRSGSSLGELFSEELAKLRGLLEDLPEEDMGSSASTDAASKYREEQKARERDR